MNFKEIVGEFFRYAIVGGIAFLADFGVLVCAQELLFNEYAWGVYVATALGFCCGLLVNYFLSLLIVFSKTKYGAKGRSVGAFLVFGLIGLAGLGLTELGMWIGIEIMAWNYMLVKVVVTGIVLAWNYLGRKIIVFR